MKDFRFSFKIPIYNARLYFILSDDIPKAVKTLPKNLQNSDGEQCVGLYCANTPLYSIIVSQDTYGTITHEIGHVCRQLMQDIGFNIAADNDEPLAYLEGFVADEIYKRLEKHAEENSA